MIESASSVTTFWRCGVCQSSWTRDGYTHPAECPECGSRIAVEKVADTSVRVGTMGFELRTRKGGP